MYVCMYVCMYVYRPRLYIYIYGYFIYTEIIYIYMYVYRPRLYTFLNLTAVQCFLFLIWRVVCLF